MYPEGFLGSVLGAPWIGIAITLTLIVGLMIIMVGVILGLSQWGYRFRFRVRIPLILLGFIWVWRSAAFLETPVITGAGIVVLIATVIVMFLLLIELIVRAWERFKEAEAAKTVIDALGEPPPYSFDPIKNFTDGK